MEIRYIVIRTDLFKGRVFMVLSSKMIRLLYLGIAELVITGQTKESRKRACFIAVFMFAQSCSSSLVWLTISTDSRQGQRDDRSLGSVRSVIL